MTAVTEIQRHHGPNDERIYSIPVQVFPNLTANVYVVIDGEYTALIDTGSGSAQSNADLSAGLDAIRDTWREPVSFERLSRIIVTHAHVDHHGGLDHVRARTGAPVAIHERDQRVLASYRERFLLTRRAVASFLRQAGVSGTRYGAMMHLYGSGKSSFIGERAATILSAGDLLDERFRVYHTPGHCPGQVCLQLGDVLFSADHILARTFPHLAPEGITPGTGLHHYLHALDAIENVPGIRLTLAGHEDPIPDLQARTATLRASHERKLERILALCDAPRSIDELTERVYPGVYPHARTYDALLALQKVGAYVEYLNAQNRLTVANLDEIASDEHVVPTYQVWA